MFTCFVSSVGTGVSRPPSGATGSHPGTGVDEASDGTVPLAVRVDVEAFAIDAHRRGDDEPAHRLAGEPFQQHRGRKVVAADIAYDLVHALPDADLGCEMEHAVDAVERAVEQIGIAEIAFEELHARQHGFTIAVHLRHQAVHHANVITVRQQLAAQLATDESRAARNKIARCHSVLRCPAAR